MASINYLRYKECKLKIKKEGLAEEKDEKVEKKGHIRQNLYKEKILSLFLKKLPIRIKRQ